MWHIFVVGNLVKYFRNNDAYEETPKLRDERTSTSIFLGGAKILMTILIT